MAGQPIKVKTSADLARLLGRGLPREKVRTKAGKLAILAPKPTPHQEGAYAAKGDHRVTYDSTDEADYADLLEGQKARGEIKAWWYHAERLNLGDGAWYTPDFRVLMTDDRIEFIEIKGFQREAARVRLRTAASLHPYRFRMAQKRKKAEGGGWAILYDSHATKKEV